MGLSTARAASVAKTKEDALAVVELAACVEVETRARVRRPTQLRGAKRSGAETPRALMRVWLVAKRKLGAHYWYQYRAFKPTRAMTTYLWLDRDPGHDDAMAIILAAHGMNPNVIVAGVSTTCGNQTLAKTTDNALRILHLIGATTSGRPPRAPEPRSRASVVL